LPVSLVSGVVNCRYPGLSVAVHLGSFLKNQGGLLPNQQTRSKLQLQLQVQSVACNLTLNKTATLPVASASVVPWYWQSSAVVSNHTKYKSAHTNERL